MQALLGVKCAKWTVLGTRVVQIFRVFGGCRETCLTRPGTCEFICSVSYWGQASLHHVLRWEGVILMLCVGAYIEESIPGGL